MTEYGRFYHSDTTWSFMASLVEQRGNRLLIDRIDLLRASFIHVKANINANDAVRASLHPTHCRSYELIFREKRVP